jgi:hypothetical protein
MMAQIEVFILFLIITSSLAFVHPRHYCYNHHGKSKKNPRTLASGNNLLKNHHRHIASSKILFLSSNNEEVESQQGQNNNNTNNQKAALKPPPINIRKESILFDDNAATAQNNNISKLWQILKMNLPYVFTGVNKNDTSSALNSSIDENPVGAIYNMVFVRFPSVLAGVVYTKNLIQGYPLYCDLGFGAGPFEIPPLFVYGVLLIILR